MLRLGGHLLSAVRAASPLPAASSLPLHRFFLYSTTNTTPSSQFVVEDYLTTSCGLTPEQAGRASRYLPSLKSPDNPDAVRAFLAGIGVSKAEVAAAISRDPRFLCHKVDITLSPRIAQLRDVGLSPPQISRLISVAPTILVLPGLIPRLAFYLSFLGSYDNLHTALRRSMYLLTQNLERVVKPNMAFLRQSGLTDSDIAKILLATPSMLALELGRVKEILECADLFGVPRDSAMFKHALMSIRNISPRKISARSDFLKKTIGCSQAELGAAVRKWPNVLNFSEGRLSRVVDFLKTKVGLEPEYIVRRPAVLTYSLPRRLMPRHYVLKALKVKGLVEKDVDFYTAVALTEKKFIKRFIDPCKNSAPGLADTYAAACAGQVPPVIQP
ncbi:transcription termination factor MTERF4, chloroplastic-like [Miscanthus floridulus]|uniref:transcription termination factor MTERF4, chloroplastic-like n=1 Tax=Miscanthus floridulus TaxID=154761 RepID=UPI00345ACB14